MELNDLPDLSTWRYVEVWTIEEAAKLWGGIDPADWPDIDLEQIKEFIHISQYKKAWIARRAMAEAVCAGILPFVEAVELRKSNDAFISVYPYVIGANELPSIESILFHKTRISQSSLLKWFAKKNLPSMRADLMALQKSEQSTVAEIDITPAKLLLPNGYSTPALELVATHIEENLAGIPEDQFPSSAEQRTWLKDQARYRGLSDRDAEAIYKVCAPQTIKKGGRPKTKKE